jgi:hypothetical protein
MAWSASDLLEIENAIKSGTLRVKYSDKEVTYRSLEEMLKIRDLIRKSVSEGTRGPIRFAVQVEKAD